MAIDTILPDGRGWETAHPRVGAVDNLQEDKFSITGRQGEIHINGANGEQIEIYSTSGILQYRAISDGNDVISLPAGIYIVKVDGKTYKLAI